VSVLAVLPAYRKPSSPPTGPAFGRPDDRLQRGSSTLRILDFIAGALEYWVTRSKPGDDVCRCGFLTR
jgi:hypothetical protein